MKISDQKLSRAIEATENWLKHAKDKTKYSEYGLTIYGCESRNLEEYKEMLGRNPKTFTGREKDLFRAI